MALTKATQNVILDNICTTDTTQVITGNKIFNNANITGSLSGNVTGNVTGNVNGNLTGNVTGNVTGNADTATKLSTPRTINISGDVTGTATSFDGSANISIPTTISSGATITSPVFAGTATGTLIVSGGVTANVTGNLTGSLTSGGSISSQTVQSASGTSAVNFTSIPSWVKRITILFESLSTTGSSILLAQIGSGSYVSSGYTASAGYSGSITNQTTGFGFTFNNAAANSHYGRAVIELISTNKWIFSCSIWQNGNNIVGTGVGSVIISGPLDRVRITTVNGTDLFDNGTINISYEG